jgi:type I restriction enzyme R subunit
MKETDMAVIVSQSQNEIEDLKAKGVDIAPHRRRMVKEDLDEKFKDPADKFRIVFVCAMWMTGFDVPCCSTIYLDKPMRNHTLMQTIARANRVFGEKKNGLIVDYVGVFRNLQKALAIYGSSYGGGVKEGETPVRDKSELVEELREAMAETEEFCKGRNINLENIEKAKEFARVKLLDDAMEAIVINDESKRKFLFLASNVVGLYKAVLPDPAATELSHRCRLIVVIAEKIRSLIPQADISEVMGKVETLLDSSIAAEGYIIREVEEGKRYVDLSKIDFEALKKHFEKSRKHIEIEILRGAINSKLKQLIRLNRTRINFLEKFQQMIDEYNCGSMNTDEFFRRLTEFAQELNEEEKRGITEQLSEEELTIFDLLTKPEMSLTEKEKKEVKKVAKELLVTLNNGKLVLDWRKKQQSQASVRVAIEQVLESLPQCYTKNLYQWKCNLIYQHIFDSYYGEGGSIYSIAS